jgi:hypothetical protein
MFCKGISHDDRQAMERPDAPPMGEAQTGWRADDAAMDQGTDSEEVDERLFAHAPPDTGPGDVHHAEQRIRQKRSI